MFERYKLSAAEKAQLSKNLNSGFAFDPKKLEIEQELTVQDLLQ